MPVLERFGQEFQLRPPWCVSPLRPAFTVDVAG